MATAGDMDREDDDPVGEGDGLTAPDLGSLFASSS